MNIDEYTRSKKQKNTNDNKINYLKCLVTRILLSIILVISISISIKLDDNNTKIINKYLFEDSLKFTKINNWYQERVGKLIPDVKTEDTLVFNSDDIKLHSYTKYHDGVKITLSKNSPISSLNGGIVIFMGNKDSYGNTIIIQGNDGIDYWYGSITNSNINLYDYIEKNTLIGETNEDYLYLILQKDGKYLNYEEYISKV